MTMIMMYVCSQTEPESAIEDYGSKNKKKSRVRHLKIKYYRIYFQPNYVCRISVQCYQKKIGK